MNAAVWKWLTLGLVSVVVLGAVWLAGALQESPRSSGLQLASAAPNGEVTPAPSMSFPPPQHTASANHSLRR